MVRDIAALLREDGIEREGALPGARVADDQLALSLADAGTIVSTIFQPDISGRFTSRAR